MATSEKIIADFSRAEDVQRWLPQDDIVMGGLSNSRIQATDNGPVLFSGRVSLENYGGFASARSQNNDYFGGYDGIMLRVKGDGKKYGLFVETAALFDDSFYLGSFPTTKDTWITVQLPFKEFVPIARGEVLSDAQPLNAATIDMFGLIIADNQEGPFALEIAEIKAYRE